MSEKENKSIIYGRNAVMEAINAGVEIEKIVIQKNIEGSGKKIFAMAKNKGISVQSVDKVVLDKMVGSGAHQGVAIAVSEFSYSSVDEILASSKKKDKSPFVIILDGIEDPHNLGAIIRSAEGAGVDGIIIPKNRAASVNGTVIKVSAGAASYMPVAKVANIANAIADLKSKGVWAYGLDMDGQSYSETDFAGGVALVIGSEGSGMSRIVKESCDVIVSIPMHGQINSLNASNAAAIVMYEVAGKR